MAHSEHFKSVDSMDGSLIDIDKLYKFLQEFYMNGELFPDGHGWEHVKGVIERSDTICSLMKADGEKVDAVLANAISCLHDIGNFVNRKPHEVFGYGLIMGNLSVEDVIKLSKSNYEKKTQNELVKIADDFSKGKIDEENKSFIENAYLSVMKYNVAVKGSNPQDLLNDIKAELAEFAKNGLDEMLVNSIFEKIKKEYNGLEEPPKHMPALETMIKKLQEIILNNSKEFVALGVAYHNADFQKVEDINQYPENERYNDENNKDKKNLIWFHGNCNEYAVIKDADKDYSKDMAMYRNYIYTRNHLLSTAFNDDKLKNLYQEKVVNATKDIILKDIDKKIELAKINKKELEEKRDNQLFGRLRHNIPIARLNNEIEKLENSKKEFENAFADKGKMEEMGQAIFEIVIASNVEKSPFNVDFSKTFGFLPENLQNDYLLTKTNHLPLSMELYQMFDDKLMPFIIVNCINETNRRLGAKGVDAHSFVDQITGKNMIQENIWGQDIAKLREQGAIEKEFLSPNSVFYKMGLEAQVSTDLYKVSQKDKSFTLGKEMLAAFQDGANKIAENVRSKIMDCIKEKIEDSIIVNEVLDKAENFIESLDNISRQAQEQEMALAGR